VELVHVTTKAFGMDPSPSYMTVPQRRVSETVPLRRTPDDETFAAAVTLTCRECDETYRVGILNKRTLLRRHRRSFTLWAYVLFAAALETTLALVFSDGFAEAANGNIGAIIGLSIGIFLCALPAMVAYSALRGLADQIVRLTDPETPDLLHAWVTTTPKGKIIAHVADRPGENVRRRIRRLDPQG
jgi:hypothetical protein